MSDLTWASFFQFCGSTDHTVMPLLLVGWSCPWALSPKIFNIDLSDVWTDDRMERLLPDDDLMVPQYVHSYSLNNKRGHWLLCRAAGSIAHCWIVLGGGSGDPGSFLCLWDWRGCSSNHFTTDVLQKQDKATVSRLKSWSLVFIFILFHSPIV